ncbi:hypothetical protein G6F42_028944 [Rhizopus arrhizus]|nr:hypothetical protein G6F42_028944 [Rhizopus arrhizus]
MSTDDSTLARETVYTYYGQQRPSCQHNGLGGSQRPNVEFDFSNSSPKFPSIHEYPSSQSASIYLSSIHPSLLMYRWSILYLSGFNEFNHAE